MRHAGLNHIEGLKNIKSKVTSMGLTIHVYGPECPATLFVPMALGLADVVDETFMDAWEGKPTKTPEVPKRMEAKLQTLSCCIAIKERHPNHVFSGGHASLQMTEDTQCVVYNLQTAAVQRMLDFDIMCKRRSPL